PGETRAGPSNPGSPVATRWPRRFGEPGCVTGIAVPEFGRAETLAPVGTISPAHTGLCLPHRLPGPAHSREKPGFSTLARYFLSETDCLLEGDGLELIVPRRESRGFPKYSGHRGSLEHRRGDVANPPTPIETRPAEWNPG